MTPFLPDAERLAAVRQALPATSAGIYLDTATAGPLPSETAAAMAQVAEWDLRTGRVHGAIETDTADRRDEARAAVAAILRADIDAVALTHGTVDALNLVFAGSSLRPGDRVVSTADEPPTTNSALRALELAGVEVARIDTADAADETVLVAQLEAAVTPGCRLVVASHVGWSTGIVLPIEPVSAVVRHRDALLFVDGDRAAGALPVDPGGQGADLYAVSGQCWLLGPEGTGALWLGDRAIARVRPPAVRAGLEMPGSAGGDPRRSDASQFEVPAFDRSSIVGLARSCGWLSMYVGLEWIHERSASLARRLLDDLEAIDGVEVLTARARMASIVTFRLVGWPVERALDELERRTFVLARPIPELDAIRLSVGFFNTEEELATIATAISDLAGHTPDEILPKRPLTILGNA